MVEEYISREAAIAARKRSCDRNCAECDFAINGDSWCNGEVFVVDLLRIPAADVRPVVKAHWKPGDIRNVSAVCSNCGHLRLGNGAEWATKLAYFCEKCGADMRPEPPKEGEL